MVNNNNNDNKTNQARTPEDRFPCRIFANESLGGSVTNAVSNLKNHDRLNIKFENSFNEVPENNVVPQIQDVESTDPAVKVSRFMKEYDYRVNSGKIYYKPEEGN